MKLLPWWLVLWIFLASHYALHSLFVSPCGILGINSATKTDVSRAVRKISLCTHPDRFSSPEDKFIADILFKRVSTAQAQLQADAKWARRNKLQPSCWLRESDQVMQFFAFLVQCIFEGPAFLMRVATGDFEGIMEVFFAGLFVYGVWFCLKSVWKYHIYIVIGLIMRPIPTLLRFLQTPFIRLYVFSIEAGIFWRHRKQRLANWESDSDASQSNAADLDDTAKERLLDEQRRQQEQERLAERLARQAEPSQVRRRQGRVSGRTHEQRTEEERRNALLGLGRRFVDPDTSGSESEPEPEPEPENEQQEGGGEVEGDGTEGEGRDREGHVQRKFMVAPMGLFDEEKIISTVSTKPTRLRKGMRRLGVAVIQFDFFLHLTKNIVPLVMLATLGQVYNGLFTSIAIGWIIRRFPRMGYETLHLWCFLFGLLHTYLALGAGQISSQAEGPGRVILVWGWSFRDQVALGMLAAQGAVFAAATGMGNEPMLTTSFTAGIAARIWAYEWLHAKFDLDTLLGFFGINPVDLPFQMASEADSVIRAKWGIGTCGGGPIRLLAGDYAGWASIYIKIAVLVLPVLYSLQWGMRLWKAVDASSAPQVANGRVVGTVTSWEMVARGMLCLIGCLLVIFVITHPFNAINSSLSGLLFAGLSSMYLESLLSTYDIRGGGERFWSWVLFIFQ